MKKYRFLPLIAAFLFSTVSCYAQEAGYRILVSQDFTEALANVLSEFTDIAQQAEALLTAGGAWPDDPLYPWARRANIRIIPIDITTA